MIRAQNKIDFIENIKMLLGAPIINIPIVEAQWDLIIEEALNFYTQNIYDGTQEVFFKLRLPAGTKEVDFTQSGMPSDIFTIEEIMYESSINGIYPAPFGVTTEMTNFFFGLANMAHGTMVDGHIMFQNLETFKKMFIPKTAWVYNFNTRKLILNTHQIQDFNVGILASRLIDFEGNSTGNLWNNSFFKKYVMALAKKQYAVNLGANLLGSSSLPGGASIELKDLMDGAKEELQQLEEFAYENFLGADFFNIEIG